MDDPKRFQDTIVEAIELSTNRLIVSTRLDQPLVGFAGRRAVYGPGIDAVGNPVVVVWQLQVNPPER